jgi:DNA-binding GntR family transcriptional regulator
MRGNSDRGVGLLEESRVADALGVVGPPTLVREKAFETLRDAIITGQLRPGTRLIERELCEAMGVSRASIREVIRQLEAERLLDVGARRGPSVSMLSRKQAREIYELREMLEVRLIEAFIAQATDDQVAGLRAIFQELDEAAGRLELDLPVLVEIMVRFNKHIVHTLDHEIFDDILDHVNARISWLRMTSMSKPGRVEASRGEIRAIVSAVEARDPVAAVRSVQIYVTNARDAALEQLPD